MQYLFLFTTRLVARTRLSLLRYSKLFYYTHALQANTIMLPGLSHDSLLSHRF